jgi:hypothetical protein
MNARVCVHSFDTKQVGRAGNGLRSCFFLRGSFHAGEQDREQDKEQDSGTRVDRQSGSHHDRDVN